jgi:hypothetical protein
VTPGKPRVPRPAHHLLPQPTEDAACLFLTASSHSQRPFVRASRCANSPNNDAGLRAPQLDRIEQRASGRSLVFKVTARCPCRQQVPTEALAKEPPRPNLRELRCCAVSVPSVPRDLSELEVHAGANSLDGQVRGTVERISAAGAIGDGASAFVVGKLANKYSPLNASLSFLIHCVYVSRLSYKATTRLVGRLMFVTMKSTRR